MSSQLPPSENLPIFDSSVFTVGDEALTYNKALKYFLRFPFAQGTETLATTNVSGVFTANSTSVFNDDVTINNTALGVSNPLTIYDPPSGRSAIISNGSGNMFLSVLNPASVINLNIGGSNLLTLTNSTLTTTVALPVPTDNTTKIATTAWVQTVNKPATALTVVLNNATATACSFPMVVGTTSGTYTPINISNTLSFIPSTATLNLNGTITSNLFRTNPNGTIRIYDTGGVSFTQLSETGTQFVSTLPNTGEFLITTNGQGALPAANAATGTSILWNVSNGGGESVFLNYQGAGATGGYDFYNITPSSSASKIASITKTQPVPTDSTTNLATTAWVQTAISAALPAYIPKFTYFSPTSFDPTAVTFKQIAQINTVSTSAFVQVTGVIPPSYKFRLSYNLYSTDYAIAYSFMGDIDLYPSRLTSSAPVVAGSTQFTSGNPTTMNLTNAVAGLSTTYNYTNATYTPFNRPFWISCQNGGFFSGGNTTFAFILAQWTTQISGTVQLALFIVTPGIVGAPTALNPTNGFTAGQLAMTNYTIEFLGSNVGSGTVTLL